jgi:hypothetical protein
LTLSSTVVAPITLQYRCDGGVANTGAASDCTGTGTTHFWTGAAWSTTLTNLTTTCVNCATPSASWSYASAPTAAALVNNEVYTVATTATDGAGNTTTATATWTYAPTISISVVQTTPAILAALPPATATTDGTWYSAVTVTTPSSGGFTLAARRVNGAANPTLRLGATATYFPEMTSYPTAPASYVANKFAFRVGQTGTDASLQKTATWGTDAARLWSGLPTTDTTLTSTASYNAAAQNVRVEYKIQAANIQSAGTYGGDIIYTATVTP